MPGERKIHPEPVSRLGGIPLSLGFFSGFSILLLHPGKQHFSPWMFLPALVVFVAGLWDDVRPLSVPAKLLVQIAVSIWTAVLLSPNFGIAIFAVCWLVFLPNALNFLDGWDGLLLSQVFWALLYFLLLPDGAQLNWIFPLMGSVSGLLIFNFPRAKIFPGDASAYFLGFILATAALLNFLHLQNHSLPKMVLGTFLLLSIPISDTLFSLIRRIVQGKSPFHPDLGHIHHHFYFWLSKRKGLEKIYPKMGLVLWNIYFAICFLMANWLVER